MLRHSQTSIIEYHNEIMLSTNIRRLFPAMLITNLTITHYVATLDFF